MAELEDKHWWFVGRRQIIQSTLNGLGLPKQANILDAGCGTGGNMQLLSHFGTVKAMEMDDNAREHANRRKLGEVLAGHLPDAIPYPANSFDLIVLLDVLEHIEDDRASLKALKKCLLADGRILLTVPAFQMLWGPHDELHHHKRRYTAKQLRQTAKSVGLEIEYISYFNTWLFPLIAAARLFQRNKKIDNADLSLPPRLINACLSHLFSSEHLFIPRVSLPFGVSLLAVLKPAK